MLTVQFAHAIRPAHVANAAADLVHLSSKIAHPAEIVYLSIATQFSTYMRDCDRMSGWPKTENMAIKRVAVIGLGPGGAITIDALTQEKAFDTIRVFERREAPGGCW
jgi:NADPH-dependent glutamate synthase beta subunit-like oxidoreductase